MRKKNGFTLVELLAVIVVLALVLVISIPAIMGTTSDAKKQSFYLYAQSLYSKTVKQYNEDVDNSIDSIDCKTYNISKDLGISNTGTYKGWLQVKRVATDSGKRNVTIHLSDADGLYHVDYCVSKGEMCNPNVGYTIEEDAKQADITEGLEEGYYLCVNYSKPVDGELVKSTRVCKNYSEGTSLTNSYKYTVNITMSDGTYAVENYTIEGTDVEDTSKEKKRFYTAIDHYKTVHSSELNDMPISSPVCNPGDPVTTIRNEKNNSGNQTTSQSNTSNIKTTTYKVTTVDTRNNNILLNNLSIDGQEISFEPTKFYYDLNVANSVSSVTIRATKQGNSSIKYEGMNEFGVANLKVGTNTIKIILTDNETGSTATYRITITRYPSQGGVPTTTAKTYDQDEPWDPSSGLPDPSLEDSNALLKNIIISGGYKIPFESNTYAYDLVTKGNDMLVIDAIQQVQGGKIIIDGNENLSKGGQIIITSISKNGYYSKKYIINVTSNVEKPLINTIIKWLTIVLSVILGFLLINIISRQMKNKKINQQIDEIAHKKAEEIRREHQEQASEFEEVTETTTPTDATAQTPANPEPAEENDNPFNSQG